MDWHPDHIIDLANCGRIIHSCYIGVQGHKSYTLNKAESSIIDLFQMGDCLKKDTL